MRSGAGWRPGSGPRTRRCARRSASSPARARSPTSARSPTGGPTTRERRAPARHRGAHLVGRQAAKQRDRHQPQGLRFSSSSGPAPDRTLANRRFCVQGWVDFHPSRKAEASDYSVPERGRVRCPARCSPSTSAARPRRSPATSPAQYRVLEMRELRRPGAELSVSKSPVHPCAMREHDLVRIGKAGIARTRPPIGSFDLVTIYREVLDGTHGRQRER